MENNHLVKSRYMKLSFIQISTAFYFPGDPDSVVAVPFDPRDTCRNIAMKLQRYLSTEVIDRYFEGSNMDLKYNGTRYAQWEKNHLDPELDRLQVWFMTEWVEIPPEEALLKVSGFLSRLIDKHGICPKCEEMYSHHLDEPFASCSCGTSEWHDFTPYMKMEKALRMREEQIAHLQGEKASLRQVISDLDSSAEALRRINSLQQLPRR